MDRQNEQIDLFWQLLYEDRHKMSIPGIGAIIDESEHNSTYHSTKNNNQYIQLQSVLQDPGLEIQPPSDAHAIPPQPKQDSSENRSSNSQIDQFKVTPELVLAPAEDDYFAIDQQKINQPFQFELSLVQQPRQEDSQISIKDRSVKDKRTLQKNVGAILMRTVRNAIKNVDSRLLKEHQEHKRSKSKCDIFLLLQKMPNDRDFQSRILRELEHQSQKLLTKRQKQMKHSPEYFEGLRLEFLYFQEAMQSFFNKQIYKAFLLAYGHNQRPQLLHQKTRYAVDQALYRFQRAGVPIDLSAIRQK